MAGFLDASDGVFVNVGGTTGELVRDPNTNELKVVIGSSQPVGGGPGGITQTTASGNPTGVGFLSLFRKYPWAIPLGVVLLVVVLAMGFSRRA